MTTGEARQARSIALEISGVLNATVFGGSLHLAVASAGEMAPKIHAELTRRGIEVLDIRSLPPGMEDVFIDYTTRSRRNREGGEMP